MGGLEINERTLDAFKNEPRFNVFKLFIDFYNGREHNKLWYGEFLDHYAMLEVHGGETFAESMDYYRLNWFIKWFEKIAPY